MGKAILAKKSDGLLIEHDISSILATEILPDNCTDEVKKAIIFIAWLERTFSRTRYPITIKGKIIEPSKQFNEKETKDILDKTKKTFLLLKEIYSKI